MTSTLFSFVVFICVIFTVNADFGWLEEGTVKKQKVLIDPKQNKVVLVFSKYKKEWSTVSGSTGPTHYGTLGEDKFKHVDANYFRNNKKGSKYAMAISYKDDDDVFHFAFVYSDSAEGLAKKGEAFAKDYEGAAVEHTHYYKYIKEQKIIDELARVDTWLGDGTPIFGWLKPNIDYTKLRNDQHSSKVHKATTIMEKVPSTDKDYKFLSNEKVYTHLTKNFFHDKVGKTNVQFIYDSNGDLQIVGKGKAGSAFAQAHNVIAEHQQYIVKQLQDPPTSETFYQTETVSCGVVAINNLAGFKLLDYETTKKKWKRHCETKWAVDSKEWATKFTKKPTKKEIKKEIKDCMAEHYTAGGLMQAGFEHLLDQVPWAYDSPPDPLDTDGTFLSKLQAKESERNFLGFIFTMSRYHGFGDGHYMAIRREFDSNGDVFWRKIDGAAIYQMLSKKKIDYNTKWFTTDGTSIKISHHDSVTDEQFTTQELFAYLKEKYDEYKQGCADYDKVEQRWIKSRKRESTRKKKLHYPHRPTLRVIKRKKWSGSSGSSAMIDDYGDIMNENNEQMDGYVMDYQIESFNMIDLILLMDIFGLSILFCFCMMFGCAIVGIYWYKNMQPKQNNVDKCRTIQP